MPIIKRDAPKAAPPAAAPAASLADLASADPDTRWRAARDLDPKPDAVSALAASLGTETVPRVREALITALMRIGDEASVRTLLPYLRAQDAGMRGAAIVALQALPEAVRPFMAVLFRDSDPDIRLLATDLVRNMPAADATPLLVTLLEDEQHPNVCGAAVEVLLEVGNADSLPVLRKCAARFADVPFLRFAIASVIGRIIETEG